MAGQIAQPGRRGGEELLGIPFGLLGPQSQCDGDPEGRGDHGGEAELGRQVDPDEAARAAAHLRQHGGNPGSESISVADWSSPPTTTPMTANPAAQPTSPARPWRQARPKALDRLGEASAAPVRVAMRPAPRSRRSRTTTLASSPAARAATPSRATQVRFAAKAWACSAQPRGEPDEPLWRGRVPVDDGTQQV